MYEMYLASGALLVLTGLSILAYLIHQRIKRGVRKEVCTLCQVAATIILGTFYIYAAISMNEQVMSIVSVKNESIDYIEAFNPTYFTSHYSEFVQTSRQMQCTRNNFLQEGATAYSLTQGLVAFQISISARCGRGEVTKPPIYSTLWFIPVGALTVLYYLKTPKETEVRQILKAKEVRTETEEMQEQINRTLGKIYDIISNASEIAAPHRYSITVGCEYGPIYDVGTKVYTIILYNLAYFVILCYGLIKYEKYDGGSLRQLRMSVSALLVWLPTVLEAIIRTFVVIKPVDFVTELLTSLSNIGHVIENINVVLPQNKVNNQRNPNNQEAM